MDDCVPEVPFNFLQPNMKAQVSQAGYGGPYVIRSNPIGAIIDAVRGICFPAPMQEDGNGGYSDLSGADTGSPGTDSSPYLGSLDSGSIGYGYGGNFGGIPQGSGAPMCGGGTTYDPSSMSCIPSMSVIPTTTDTSPCGAAALEMAQSKLITAAQNYDLAGCIAMEQLAGICSASASAALRPQWVAFRHTATNYRKGVQSANRNKPKTMNSATIAAVQRGKMPAVPNPMTLTEGNVGMKSYIEPLQGAFDPAGYRRF